MDFFGDNIEGPNRQRQAVQGGGQHEEGDPFGFASYQSPYSWRPVDAESQAMYQEYMEREWARQQAATRVVINEPTNDDVYRPQVEAVSQNYEQHGNVGGLSNRKMRRDENKRKMMQKVRRKKRRSKTFQRRKGLVR